MNNLPPIDLLHDEFTGDKFTKQYLPHDEFN